jgi:glutathione synthase/RimK-type ligase-like ATP-grasp enzyme
VSEWDEGVNGWIASPNLIFHGLQSCLHGIGATLLSQKQILSPASPKHTALLFDKNETSSRLRAVGIPVPECFQPAGDADSLIEQLRSRRWSKAYVKLAYGSCASGIVVLEPLVDPCSGLTTVKEIDGLYYNTFDVRRVVGEELTSILNFVLKETATVQTAIPKTRIGNRNFDLRVVVLGGTVIAVVCRVSRHPMTNLHLGGQRGDVEECRRQIGQRHWLDAMDDCVHAASLFDLPCVGIDVAFDRNSGSPFILEMNSFGDFFPNWKDSSGRSIHELEIEQSASCFG